MRAADRRGLLRAPVTVALQTAITQKEKRENALSGLPSTTRAVRRRASRAGSPPSYAEVRDFAQWVWTREVVVGGMGTGKLARGPSPSGGRVSGARHGAMVTATALYAFYTPVTAVDRPEACLRRNESPAATLTTTLTRYIHTTAWFSTSPFSTCTSTYPNTCFTADICFSTTIHLLPQHERFQSFNFIMDPEVAERWLVHHKRTGQ